MEIWKDIDGYEGLYQISNEGRVKSLKYNHTNEEKFLKAKRNRNGYLLVGLCKDGKPKKKLVHRLVAEAFIENPNGLPQVNHKDENKMNNCVENLEWCDASYNTNYGTRNERSAKARTNGKRSKQVCQYDLNWNLIRIWPSTKECGRNGYDQSAVCHCCNNKFKREGNNKYKGYRWRYNLT